ncbi:uncharacterized protein LOC108666827 [Hyalella azteca]|uniref:Innexin n=1 Tax=Hyalella azteca TaxID=294128 RepID=A0A8B7N5W8_HYAAZ|nr:uncharacterized protein LOC108666827 [Hyalella azteca]
MMYQSDENCESGGEDQLDDGIDRVSDEIEGGADGNEDPIYNGSCDNASVADGEQDDSNSQADFCDSNERNDDATNFEGNNQSIFRGSNKRGKNRKNRGRGRGGRGNFHNDSNKFTNSIKTEVGVDLGNRDSQLNTDCDSFYNREQVLKLENECILGGKHEQKNPAQSFRPASWNKLLLFGNLCNKKAPAENSQFGKNPNNNNKGGNNKGNNQPNGNNNNNNNNKGGGDLKGDAFSWHMKHLCYSIGLLKHSNGPGYTLESLCLQFHYRFLVFFFCICYFIVMLNWFVNEKIVCYELQRPDKPYIPKGHSSNVCLSYPYIEVENKHRRYLLFYRWVPYSFLLVAALFYTLRAGLVKKWEDTRLAALYKDVWNERCNYLTEKWEGTNNLVVQFLRTGQSVSSHYVRWILCHVFANLVDLVAVLVFQFVLQGEFVSLVPNVLHGLERNPANFTDKLSTIFPPFAECQISAAHKIVDGYVINFGCHLTHMELYEKIFIITWLVLALHWLWSFAMVIWLSIGMVPFFGKFTCVVTGRLINRKSAAIMVKAVRVCSMGDVHVLYLVKKWMSNAQFEQLLKAVVNSKEEELRKHGCLGSPRCYCSRVTTLQVEEPGSQAYKHEGRTDASAPPQHQVLWVPDGNDLIDQTYIEQFYCGQSNPDNKYVGNESNQINGVRNRNWKQ